MIAKIMNNFDNLTIPQSILLVWVILSVIYIFFAPRYEFQAPAQTKLEYLRLDTRTGEVCVGSVKESRLIRLKQQKQVTVCHN